MSRWEQHYYTWSTNSLSGNKVGLGIVAASEMEDRNLLRAVEEQGAGSNVLREETVTIEKMVYHEGLPGYIRTGATPCSSGADLRNNKFVHIYSLKDNRPFAPEEYLTPLDYQKEWDGKQKLPVVMIDEEEGKGRKEALRILTEFQLSERLEELFFSVYHCILTGEKPLFIVNSGIQAEDFSEFSRKFMILIHYMLPVSLRKEADYISYAREDERGAHFLFGTCGGDHVFSMQEAGREKREYLLLEKEFYQKLAEAFLAEDDRFEQYMDGMEQLFTGLADKRNRLSKCIFAFMADEMEEAGDRESYFRETDRLMYWARKDKSLLPVLEKATKRLDFHLMDEEDLSAYISVLLTGAGGETKEAVFHELGRMLSYYNRTKDDRFDVILGKIRNKNQTVYEQLLEENRGEDGFLKKVLYQPITDVKELEEAVKLHGNFLKDEEYRYYVAESAYKLYEDTKSREVREKVEMLGKQADEVIFVEWKKKEVKKILDRADSLNEFFDLTDRMEFDELESSIQTEICDMAMNLFCREENELIRELLPGKTTFIHKEKGNRVKKKEEKIRRLIRLSEELSCRDRMDEKLRDYYRKRLEPVIGRMDAQELIRISLWNKDRSAEYEPYLYVLKEMVISRYMELVETQKETFYDLSVKEWIRFVLKVTNMAGKEEKLQAKEMIQSTRMIILEHGDLFYLAEANQVLKNHGIEGITCPETFWDPYKTEDFDEIHKKIHDITLVKCDESRVCRIMELLYHFKDRKMEKKDLKDLDQLLKKEPEQAEEVLKKMALLWAQDETLSLPDFYSGLEERIGQEEAYEWVKQTAAENEEALLKLRAYRKEEKGRVRKELRGNNFLSNLVKDIFSSSIWAVLLGFYGYVFITCREIGQFRSGYLLSIVFLAAALICYLVSSAAGTYEKHTPGSMIYIFGLGVLILNTGLAMDHLNHIHLFYTVICIASLVLKLIDLFFFEARENESEKESHREGKKER